MAVSAYTKTGTKATTAVKLDKTVFGVTPENHELLKASYVAYLANGRDNLAVTKTRGLVRGGGRKPWKQKGTGRARFGSSRVPIWRGGGITFGPTGEENYTKSLNTKAKRQAIRQALSVASDAGKLIVIEDFTIKSGKTADVVKLLKKIDAQRNVLLVVDQKGDELKRACQNIQNLTLVSGHYVNVYDVLNADKIIFTHAALQQTTERLKTAPKPVVKEAK
jgi:large subunit ribosomal protein L4